MSQLQPLLHYHCPLGQNTMRRVPQAGDGPTGTPSPVVVKNWPEASRIIGRFLDEGVAPARVREALEIAPNVSNGCINVALANLAKSDPVNPFTVGGRDPHGDQDRYDLTLDIDPNDPHRRDERSW